MCPVLSAKNYESADRSETGVLFPTTEIVWKHYSL
jgi:hypothetical protein